MLWPGQYFIDNAWPRKTKNGQSKKCWLELAHGTECQPFELVGGDLIS